MVIQRLAHGVFDAALGYYAGDHQRVDTQFREMLLQRGAIEAAKAVLLDDDFAVDRRELMSEIRRPAPQALAACWSPGG